MRSRNQRFGPMILEESANRSEVGGWAKEISRIQRPKGASYCVVSHNSLAHIVDYENALRSSQANVMYAGV